MVHVRELDHIVLNVADVDRSLAWYCDLLGLTPERVDEWRAGDVFFPSVRVNDACIIDLFPTDRTGENMNHLCLVVDPADVELDPLSTADVERTPNRTRDRNLELLREFSIRPLTGAARRIVLHFLVSPVEIIGTDRVKGVVIVHNELYESEDGSIRPRPTNRRTTLELGLIFRAIGYQGVPLPGIPFDAMRGVIPNEAGRIIEPRTGVPVQGEYVVGWIKRGPQGIIGTNKPDSQETVDMLLADLAAGRLHKEEVPSREVLERLLGERRRDFVSYEDWRLIDRLEQERGRASGAPRVKFSRVEEMLHALQERKRAAAEEAQAEAGES